MYPYFLDGYIAHTPDNSFLGVVVKNHLKDGEVPTKKNQGLVYGKEYYMWKVCGMTSMISTCVCEFLTVCISVQSLAF